jgi:hypothetical protein
MTENADAAAGGSLIRVGLTPPPNAIGHVTNPNQGCFDDKEGDDSVDFVFYETLIDQLKAELCYDQNRVFAVGDSSGAWLANELGCKYGGTTGPYAIRGIASHNGGLPTNPAYTPTCSGKPTAGIWAWRDPGATNALDSNKYAVDHAMQVNGCQATSLESAQFTNFPIDASSPGSVCTRILGCPEEYPLVVCKLPNGILSDDRFVNPAFATFISGFNTP